MSICVSTEDCFVQAQVTNTNMMAEPLTECSKDLKAAIDSFLSCPCSAFLSLLSTILIISRHSNEVRLTTVPTIGLNLFIGTKFVDETHAENCNVWVRPTGKGTINVNNVSTIDGESHFIPHTRALILVAVPWRRERRRFLDPKVSAIDGDHAPAVVDPTTFFASFPANLNQTVWMSDGKASNTLVEVKTDLQLCAWASGFGGVQSKSTCGRCCDWLQQHQPALLWCYMSSKKAKPIANKQDELKEDRFCFLEYHPTPMTWHQLTHQNATCTNDHHWHQVPLQGGRKSGVSRSLLDVDAVENRTIIFCDGPNGFRQMEQHRTPPKTSPDFQIAPIANVLAPKIGDRLPLSLKLLYILFCESHQNNLSLRWKQHQQQQKPQSEQSHKRSSTLNSTQTIVAK